MAEPLVPCKLCGKEMKLLTREGLKKALAHERTPQIKNALAIMPRGTRVFICLCPPSGYAVLMSPMEMEMLGIEAYDEYGKN